MTIPCNENLKRRIKKDLPKFLKWTYNGKTDLTFEEAKANIKTVEDACYIMSKQNYNFDYISNYNMKTNNINWVWGIPPKTVYDKKAGGCVGTANVFNSLLYKNFDESGYVSSITNCGGHAIDYFKLNGLYYYFDFSNVNPYYFNGISLYYDVNKELHLNPLYYLWYVTNDPKEFYEYYKKEVYFLNFDNINDEEFTFIAYQCKANGKGLYPTGFYKDNNTKGLWGYPIPQIFSKEAEDSFILLYNYYNLPIYFEQTPDYMAYDFIEPSKEKISISIDEEVKKNEFSLHNNCS